MLHSATQTIKRIFITLLFLSFGVNALLAQDTKSVVLSLDQNAISNLKNAITSDNPGLRKSGIYLAGKHSVEEVSATLLEQLDKENVTELKILIMRVLYIIDEHDHMDDIYSIALNDENEKVRRMASAIYSAMQINTSNQVADNTNQ